jgi:lipopolysaccharide transport system permease protein
MANNTKVVTYEPDNSLKKGYSRLLREIISEIVSNRWLTYQLFRRNFFAMYKQSLLGIAWVIILPILNVGVFSVLDNAGIFNIGVIKVPYPVYAIAGMAFWQIFAVGLGSSATALTSAGDMVTRINFSKKSLVFAPMGRTMVSFLIQMTLVGILLIFYKIMPEPGVLLIPLVVLPIILLTLGLGLLVAIMNAIINDIGNILPMGITFLMYLTPVLYAEPKVGILTKLTQYNPMYHFVTAGRDLILNGRISDLHGFFYSAMFSVGIFIVALVIFHLTETRIAERV